MKVRTIIAVLLALATAGPVLAEPPTWTVRDEDSQVVLFPTIHLLPDDLEWRSERLMNQLAEAEEVWFEAPLGAARESDEDVLALTIQYGMSPERPLSQRLDDKEYAALRTAAESLGLSMDQLEPMRPWLVAVTLATMELVWAGYDPESGVDVTLAGMLDDAKPIRGLESIEQQLVFFAGLSEKTEKALLLSTAEDLNSGSEALGELADAWAQGDVTRLEDRVTRSLTEFSPELYEVLIVSRNQDWADKIMIELEGSGTDFIAVGAAHLLGVGLAHDILPAADWKRSVTAREFWGTSFS